MIPLGLAMPSRQSSRRKDSGAFRLLFLSRIDAKKGLPVVLRALRAVRDAGTDAVLTVAGSGKPRYLREIERLAEGLGVTSYVRFVGFVSAETKARTLAEADLFVLPSYQENFGLAVAEAMAAGLPVIVSDQVALAPDIETAGAGLVVPCDASDALAAAVLALAADDKRRRAMGDRGRALVEREFAWDRVAREVVRLYETVINWGGAPVGAGG
jgi:glycosyltransferase involved in cell wall biosynthesis